MAQRETCAGTRSDGSPCESPFVVRGTDYCSAHQPGGSAEMSRRGLLGALASRRSDGLEDDELPALRSHEDAKRWLEAIGRAVCLGRLRESAAQAAIRAVEAWLKAEAERLTAHVVEDLRLEVDRVKAELDQKPKVAVG